MNPTPHSPRPFYIRNATTHDNLPERYATRAEALAERVRRSLYDPASIYIVKEG